MTMPTTKQTPAQTASEKALKELFGAIEQGKSFRLEAGAGAGKTYSLVKALQYIIERQGKELVRRRRQVACITYTNVASAEIPSRTGGHPAVFSATIHSFCWSIIRGYQPALREELPKLPKWDERLKEGGGLGAKPIEYDLGYPSVGEERILLGHGDVLKLAIALMQRDKFRDILADRYPIIFIDEYQDTDTDFAQVLKTYFLSQGGSPLLGFFGDSWQKIYGDGCGTMEHNSLTVIGKGANFRSAVGIINVLNNMRPQLTQLPHNPDAKGSVGVYHTNEWKGLRQTGSQWKGDLPAEEAHKYLEVLKRRLIREGWIFEPEHTKILMLTHNVLAKEQGYSGILSALGPERAIRKEDDHIKFLVEVFEPVCVAYEKKRFGEMFALLGGRPAITSWEEKAGWARDMDALVALRNKGSIGDVLDLVKKTERLRLPEAVARREARLSKPVAELEEREIRAVERLKTLRAVSYREITPLAGFIDEKTLFSTKHGVKGAEFENVLVIVGRGWNLYDFNQMLAWVQIGVPTDKNDSFERNRNLFYVACSRPKERLALLFTQLLSSEAIQTLKNWFGESNLRPAPEED